MVKYAADNAKAGGGYIFGTAHNIQADTRIENVAALFEAYHEYGVY
jgi:uroporphyrinogen-III decarboxylase